MPRADSPLVAGGRARSRWQRAAANPPRPSHWLVSAGLLVLLLVLWPAPAAASTPARKPEPYQPAFSGRVVQFDLSGFEPDYDPIYRVTIAASLHDGRPPDSAFPDAQLVLAAYLESFQPGTVPVLPDLLHPDQVAADLVGFLHGKAALVSAAGRTAYSGSLLAEIFHNNAVHISLQLYPARSGGTVLPLQLQGIFTLKKGGTQHGWMRAVGSSTFALLRARPGPALPWQQVVASLAISRPPMMGTASSPVPSSSPGAAQRHGATSTRGSEASQTRSAASSPVSAARRSSAAGDRWMLVLLFPGAVFVLVGMLVWRRTHPIQPPGLT